MRWVKAARLAKLRMAFSLSGSMTAQANVRRRPGHPDYRPDGRRGGQFRLLRVATRKSIARPGAFDTVGQSRVIAQTMTVNAGSQGVMKAVGMRYVRTYFPSWDDPLPGAESGEVEYEMTRAMWAGQRR